MTASERHNAKVTGSGERAMVFAHGFGCDQNMWRLAAPAFERDFRVVLFDHVGAGGSDPSAYDPAKYSALGGYAGDVVELCRELGVRGGVFVGHSVSAMVGVLGAKRAPELFGDLVLVGPSPRYIDDADYVGGFSEAQVHELLDFLDSNHMGWSRAMAPAIMGNADRPELADELANSFCRTDPEIAKRFARTTFLSDNRADLMRVAIYGRVSTGHQVEHQTIEQQIERLTAHVGAHTAEGWTLDPAHVFRDDGHSGAALARPGLDRLRDVIKGREVDRVLVTAPDRLARNYVHQMVLLEEWTRAGCAAEFLDRPMSDDPHDHLLLQIRGAVAEYERTLIAERMRRGRLAKLRAGALLPWTYPPYGYRLSPDRPRDPRAVTLDAAEAAVVAELFAMYREPGTSLMQLAMHLDRRGIPTPSGTPRWSSPTVLGILRNPTYTGQVYAQRTRYRAPTHRRSAVRPIGHPHGTAVPQPADTWLLVGAVPAVVSRAHFEEVQAKLSANRSFTRRNNTVRRYLLRALVSCGCCGLACTARATNGRNLYYV